MAKKDTKILMIVLCAALVLFGGFYNYSKSLLLVLVAAFILWKSLDNKRAFRVSFSSLGAIGICGLIAIFFSVDKSANFQGLVGIGALILFRMLADNSSEEDRTRALLFVPISGAIMTLIGLVVLVIPTLSELLWQSDRFGGFFQYSNTCALYLLIGLIIVEQAKLKRSFGIGTAAVLVLGILITGSRTIAILTLVWAVVVFIRNRTSRPVVGAIFGGAAVLAIGYVLVFNSFQNLGRIFTIFTTNSTFFGRILYNLDGLRILIKHPLGQGYLGYYYTKGLYQTGVYDTRFVHNDILQTGLDFGILAMAILIAAFVIQLVKGKQDYMKKEILLVTALAALTDFHFQYILIGFVVILCLDFERDIIPWQLEVVKNKMLVSGLAMGLMIWAGALSIGYLSINSGDYGTALKILGRNTEALTMELEQISDKDEAERLVEKILKENQYVMPALNACVYIELMDEEYALMVYDIGRILELDPYNTELYAKYESLIVSAEESLASNPEDERLKTLEEGRESMRASLEELKERTSPLAYKLRDKPVFEY